ncbi:cupin domain-containing protein, partial [Candidatus Peregrinibacteria bacterium CG_4_9_14_0_2_um_filter_38_9]
MKGYKGAIEQLTVENDNFRKVLYTGKHSQLVAMSLKPNEDIGMEVHEENDQFFRFEKGIG